MEKTTKCIFYIAGILLLLYVLYILFVELIFISFSGSPTFPNKGNQLLYEEILPRVISILLCINQIIKYSKCIISLIRANKD